MYKHWFIGFFYSVNARGTLIKNLSFVNIIFGKTMKMDQWIFKNVLKETRQKDDNKANKTVYAGN